MDRNLVNRPIAVGMVVIALVVLGIVAGMRLPVSLMPDIDVPQITVQISRPGSSAAEIEKGFTSLLRGQLMQVDGVSSVRSESRADVGSVVLSFEPGSDMDLLFIEVNEKIDRAMNRLPRDTERPRVIKAGAMDIPAFYLDIHLKDSLASEASRFAELGKFANSVVAQRVEQLPETAMVDMSGTTDTKIVLIPDRARMDALGLSPSQIEGTIRENDITLGALSIVDGIYRYHIHFDSQILTKGDIERIYLRHEGRLLQLGEVCKVEERMQEPTGIVRHNGKRAVTMAVIKQADARMDQLQESMGELIENMREEYPEIEFSIARDQTELLSSTMDNLRNNLIVGAILASLILLLFMKQWRLSLLVIASIPLSLMLTLLGFGALGISINIISLSGLILGTGMIVDNSIIVIDNITRRRLDGEPLTDAVVKGTREVFTPMLSSVLTTCSVFIPLVFLSGTAGALFFDQAVGMSLSLLASLLVAVTVVPVFFHVLFRKRDDAHIRRRSSLDKTGEKGIRLYEKVLGHVLRHSGLYLCAAVVAVPLTAFIASEIDKERMPALPHHDAILRINWNSGISASENDRRTAAVLEEAGAEVYTSMCGTQDFMLSHTPAITQNEAVVYVDAGDSKLLETLCNSISNALYKGYPDATLKIEEAGNLFSLMFSTDESDLEIRLQDKDGKRPPLRLTQLFIDSLGRRFPDIHINPIEKETDIRLVTDMERMAFYQVSYESLLRRLKTLVSRGQVMEINDGSKSVPVLLGAEETEAESILDKSVGNAEGVQVPIRLLVDRKSVEDYKLLHAAAEGEYYSIDINAPDREVREVMDFCREMTRDVDSPWTVSFSGGYFSSRKLIKELALVLCVALALLFFILAAQFESLIQPLIILMEMVADIFFVLLILWASGMTLNLMSMIGLVVVSGIVINDSILKVDTINRLRRGGATVVAAIVRAGHWRLRPIVMTSLTTILALLPFLWQNDMGSALQRPLSVTLVVGLTIGTVVSLFFIPLLYNIIYRGRRRGNQSRS